MTDHTSLTAPSHSQKSATPWPASSLSGKLLALLESTQTAEAIPTVGPKAAAELRQLIDAPKPEVISRAKFEVMLGKLSIAMPKAQVSDVEIEARIDIYWRALKHHYLDDMHSAFDELLRTCRFFPTVAEIEAAANPFRVQRLQRIHRAMLLLDKHEREWKQDEADPVDQSEVAELMSGLREKIDRAAAADVL